MVLKLWESDKDFLRVWKQVKDRTLVDIERCYILWQLARRYGRSGLPIAEVGVYRGGTLKLMALAAPQYTPVFGFDTFEGLPAPRPDVDDHKQGEFKADLEDVRAWLSDCPNVILVKGKFPSTALGLEDREWSAKTYPVGWSLIHIDCDLYQSVWDCCNWFVPRMAFGYGVMVFDDYGFSECGGAKRAVDEYFGTGRLIYLPTGQAVRFF